MAKTYAQFLSQIEALRSKADAVRRKEAAGQIKRVRDLISLYGLTADDLGLSTGSTASAGSRSNSVSKKSPKSKPVSGGTPKYHDGAGHSWTGRGPRPGWLKTALSAGRSLEEFASTGAPSVAEVPEARTQKMPARKRAPVKAAAKAAPAVKFRLGEHSWSGRGPQPRWMKEAIDSGKSLDDLRA